MDRDGKPKSNLIIPSSLLTDLDRRSQLRNENRSFQGRGGRQVNTSPEPILSIRSKSRLDEARRSKRNARSSDRCGRRGIGGFIETNIYIYIPVVSKVANALGSLIDAFHESSSACPPLFVSKLRSFIEQAQRYWKHFSSVIDDKSPPPKAPFLREERAIKRRRQATRSALIRRRFFAVARDKISIRWPS